MSMFWLVLSPLISIVHRPAYPLAVACALGVLSIEQAFAWRHYLRRYSTSAAWRRIEYQEGRFRAFWDDGISFSRLDWIRR